MPQTQTGAHRPCFAFLAGWPGTFLLGSHTGPWLARGAPPFGTSLPAPSGSSLAFRDARRVAVETPAGRGGARGGLSGPRCRSSRPAHARALRIRSLGPGPGSRWCARRDAEAQLGTPVTARAPAARGGPAREGSVRETDPLSVGPPRRIPASAGGGVLHAAPWGLPPPIAGDPAAAASGLSCPCSRHPLRCGRGSPACGCAHSGGAGRPGPKGVGQPGGGGSASEKLQNAPGMFACQINVEVRPSCPY